ncbi:MAG: iron chaperone [Rhodoluna sp.]
MSEKEVTAYINAQAEPKKSTLQAVRKAILEVEPGLEQAIAWNSPVFKFNGKYVAGLCAFKAHLTFSPQSAEVMAAHEKELAGYVISKNSFQFAIDKPLPKSLVSKLIKARLKEIK